ncbi:hypothetical protein [Micromonospora sp. WMMD975]|uniref:hypothetical protein n=1 Tax=Micromonospora sp. WMMD975 TaxID=3016087 RepID=UPI00249A4B39|nr:hypothetical protein [Micromonospora sp. WMMD975]WFE36893.1 hypothetical protein O7613_25770 [Micromonospora sp. WMMD975]
MPALTATARPTYCARCRRWATALIEAGQPGTGRYRAETTCARHQAAARRWASHAGPPRTTPIGPTPAVLFELPEVTR